MNKGEWANEEKLKFRQKEENFMKRINNDDTLNFCKENNDAKLN